MQETSQSPRKTSVVAGAGPRQGDRTVAAWDLPTRAFHWLLVALVAAAWASFEFSEALGDAVLKWHRWIGLMILTLLIWRLLWGFFGASTSRFANFVAGPVTLINYATSLARGGEIKYLGHNPLGSLMVVTLLGLLLTQATLGLFTVEHNDLTAGPLYLLLSEAGRKTATQWHRFLFESVTLWLIAFHIMANAFYALVRREPLIKAMITGRKPACRYKDGDEAVMARRPLLRAGLLLMIAAVIVFGGIWAVGGRFLSMRPW
ncbi:MAG: cytochrome b/b6 domain-containing protein [Alphaproteobacteria bacterium]|nr:cytochrome b/b6 domain-containing protein [Alphaproteobacteria bacterium]